MDMVIKVSRNIMHGEAFRKVDSSVVLPEIYRRVYRTFHPNPIVPAGSKDTHMVVVGELLARFFKKL